MTQVAVVEKLVDGTHAKISVARQTACGHDCSNCGGCGITSGTKVYAVARNEIGAREGEQVVVETSSKKVLGIVALVYVLPFIGLFLGYALGATTFRLADMASGVVGMLFFVAFLIPAIVYNRKVKKTGELTYTIIKRS